MLYHILIYGALNSYSYMQFHKKFIMLFYFSGSFQPSKEIMLQFYAYYKQATIGPCNVSRPRFYDVVGKLKWYVKMVTNLDS